MKALLISDLHIQLSKMQMENGKVFIPILEIVLKIIDEKKPDYLINLGDTFHSKDNVSATLLYLYKDFLLRVPKSCKIVQIVGNHDFSIVNENEIFHAMKTINNIDNLTIVDDIYKLNDRIGFMGYCRKKDLFVDRIERLGKIEFLFGHFDINGFNLGDNYIEQNAVFDMDDFKNIKYIFSGHYHEPQEKVKNNSQYVYVGSAETTTFGETDQEKRFLWLDLENGEFESIPTFRTFHKTLHMNAEDEFPIIPAEEIARGVNFKVIIKGTKAQIDLLKKPKNYKAKISYDLISQNGDVKRIDVKATDNIEDVFVKYIEYDLEKSFGGIMDSGFDPNKLIEVGKKYRNLSIGGT